MLAEMLEMLAQMLAAILEMLVSAETDGGTPQWMG
jgi:hypothetical protein